MAEQSISVDLLNPGQVLACLGFLEAAEILCGGAQGGFCDWDNNSATKFRLSTERGENPFKAVLEFLVREADIKRVAPRSYSEDDTNSEKKAADRPQLTETFMAQKADKMALPIRFGGGKYPIIEVGHWADGSGRDSFKLYSGNRSGG